MNNCLIVEDEFQVACAIESRLLDKFPNCKITKAINFYQADAALKACSTGNVFQLIISDLHMPGEGLRPSGDQPDGAILNGWVFLRDYLLKENSPYYNICRQSKIIIFSAFLDELREYINLHDEDNRLLSTTEQIPKGRIYSGQGGYNKLMEIVENSFK